MIVRSWEAFQPFANKIHQLDLEYFPFSNWDLSTWKSLFTNRDLMVAIAFKEQIIAGFAVTSQVSDEAELLKICIAEKFQGKAFGYSLLKRVTAELADKGFRRIYLEVRADNVKANRFYRCFGFSETGKRSGYYSHPVCDAVLFSIEIG